MDRVRGGAIVRPGYVWLGITSQLFVGIMAVPVGLVMDFEPNGSPLGIPNEWVATFVIGLVQGFVALFWLRRLRHLRFEDRAGSLT